MRFFWRLKGNILIVMVYIYTYIYIMETLIVIMLILMMMMMMMMMMIEILQETIDFPGKNTRSFVQKSSLKPIFTWRWVKLGLLENPAFLSIMFPAFET